MPRKEEWIVFNAFWAHAMSVGGKLQRLIQQQSRRFQDVLLKIILEGEQAGDFKKGITKDIVFLSISAVQGMASHYSMDPEPFDPQGPINLLKELILDR